MTRVVRWLAIVAAVAGLAMTTVLLVREVARVAVDDVVWGRPAWYADMVAEPSWQVAGVAGIACLAVAVVLVLVVAWLAVPGRGDGRRFEVGTGDGRATVSLDTLERLLARVAGAEVGPGGRVRRARVSRADDGLRTSARVVVPPTDLSGLHARLLARSREALGTATGLDVASLRLEVDRLIQPGKGTS